MARDQDLDDFGLPQVEIPLPRIGEAAPEFEGLSTRGRIRLSDFAGKWVVLFSHPADFTPVCTTEFVAFARAAERFERMNTQLVGLSIDSIYAHIAWIRNIEERFGVAVPFPVIADLSMEVAIQYGMLQPGASVTSTVRGLFVIDPEQLVQAIVYYPAPVGRNVAEIERLVAALQVAAEHQVATPEGWRPGDECVLPPPSTQTGAAERMAAAPDAADWYIVKTRCPTDA